MDTIKEANKIIKEGLSLLPDDAKKEFKAKASDIFEDEAISNAYGVINGNAEKEAMLAAYAVQEANRMASTLWRLQLITEELEKEYRALPTMDEVVKTYNGFLSARDERANKLTEEGNAIQEERKEMDIFMGIINGVAVEDSEKQYEAFKDAQQKALAGVR